MELLVALTKYITYLLLRAIFNLIRAIYWTVNGIYFQKWRSQRPGNEVWSAQLLDIIYKYKLDKLVEPSGPLNFITMHCAFVSPSYVLQDNVTLCYITSTEAVFVETREGLDVAHSDTGPFMR